MKIFKHIVFVISFLSSLLFISCSEDPVKPPTNNTQTIDTIAMYEWAVDTIAGYFLTDIYVADSNNIFLEGPGNSMIYYNGGSYSPINYNDPNFSSGCIDGSSENNVFIGGGKFISPGPVKPHLKVWNGSSMLSYDFPNDSGGAIYDISVTGYNEAWTHNGVHNVYHFSNSILTSYIVDTLIGSGNLYVSPGNEVYLFTSRIISSTEFINIGYKLIDNSFNVIYRDTFSANSNMNNSYFTNGKYAFRGGNRSINVLRNNNWGLLCNTFNFYPARICSNSLDSLICFGNAGVYNGVGIYFWDGMDWVIERNLWNLYYRDPIHFPPSGDASQLFIVDGKIYLNFNNYNAYSSYLLKGKPITGKGGNKMK